MYIIYYIIYIYMSNRQNACNYCNTNLVLLRRGLSGFAPKTFITDRGRP